MKTKNFNADPTIMNRDFLECDGELMDKDLISEKCDCWKRITCLAICELLAKKKPIHAQDTIEEMTLEKEWEPIDFDELMMIWEEPKKEWFDFDIMSI